MLVKYDTVDPIIARTIVVTIEVKGIDIKANIVPPIVPANLSFDACIIYLVFNILLF